MLNALADRISEARASKDVILLNALLESFLIHARCLRDFLYKRDPRVKSESRKFDDVFVDQYFSSFEEVLHWLPEQSEELGQLNKLVGKKIAHLTETRQTIESVKNHEWNVGRIREDLNQGLRLFSTKVDATKLHSDWSEKAPLDGESLEDFSGTAFNMSVTSTCLPGELTFVRCKKAVDEDK